MSEDRLKGMVIQARNSYIFAKKHNDVEGAMERLEEIGKMLQSNDENEYELVKKYLTA